jgi:squalene-hopene/tetraprenyl-beta-curcumene cyclase
MTRTLSLFAAFCILACASTWTPARTTAWAAGIDDATAQRAEAAITRGVAFLKSKQGEDGSWSPKTGPAITALALTVLADHPGTKRDEPAVTKALAYVLSKKRSDGGIHEGLLDNYNTAICLSALARFNSDPQVAQAIKDGLAYLRGIQYSGGKDENGHEITEKHAFYGGYGYGNHGRPDGSNTQVAVQAFFDNNVECDKDPAMKRALLFTQRLQGIPQNTQFGHRIQPNGGSIYATSVNKEQVGVPQSMAGEDEQGRLRTYGSMTYAMFKSYVYARLDRNDPRVKEALRWIADHYTFTHNPGMVDDPKTPKREDLQGYYYYLLTAARALHAFGEPTVTDSKGAKHNWRMDLTTRLLELQREDGSWTNESDRWLEGDPVLVTAYALLTLQQAAR